MPGLCFAALWITAVACLTSCRSSSPAGGLIPVVLQTDWYPQPEHGGFYEALLKGYYRQEGLDVTIKPGGPYISVEQQVSVGAAQFGLSSSDRVMKAVAGGQELLAVAATMQQDPQAIMVHASSPVHSFGDLEGHTIAANIGATWFAYIVRRFNLKDVHEAPATYSIANFLKDPQYIQQIFVTSEPYLTRRAGVEVRTLLISDTGYAPYRVFFTSRGMVTEHPEVVRKFVQASLRGWRDYMADPAEVHRALVKLNPELDPAQMQFTWAALRDGHFIYRDDPAQAGSFDPARWTTMRDQLASLHLLQRPIEATAAYTTQFLSAPAPQ